MKATTIKSARTFWLKVHAYLGLFSGAVLALLGITGSILVFDRQIDLFLNPHLAVQLGKLPAITYDDVIATIEDRYGQRPYYVESPAAVNRFVAFVESASDGTDNTILAISVDPNTGRILRSKPWGGYFVSFIRRLHTDLFLGQFGAYIVGSVAILSLISILTGLYLWWPRVGALRKALVIRRQVGARALNFEVHRLGGFYSATVLSAVALTGIYLALPEQYTAAVGMFSRVTPEPGEVVSGPPEANAEPLSLGAVEWAVQANVPGAVITGFQIPTSAEGAYGVYYRGPAEPFSQYGRSTLWIDQYSGQVLVSRDYDLVTTADRFISGHVLLHNGQLLGFPGQLLVFACGLTIPGMYGTGVYLWWTRRQRKRRVADDPRRMAGMSI